jgi:hypothetical protein
MNFTEFKNGPAGSVFAGLGKEWADLLLAPVASKISAARSSSATPRTSDCSSRRCVATRDVFERGIQIAARDLHVRRLRTPGRRSRRRQDLAGPRRGMRPAIPRRHRGVRDGGAVRNAGPQATSRKGKEGSGETLRRWRTERLHRFAKQATNRDFLDRCRRLNVVNKMLRVLHRSATPLQTGGSGNT